MQEQLKRADLAFAGASPDRHPQLERLLHLWEGLRHGSALPAANSFSALLHKPWLANLATVAVMNRRFRVMSMGAACVEIAGGSNVGRFVDECVASADREAALQPYRACAGEAVPLFSNAQYMRAGFACLTVHRLYLPCADDGREVDTLLIGVYPVDSRGVFGAPAAKPMSLT